MSPISDEDFIISVEKRLSGLELEIISLKKGRDSDLDNWKRAWETLTQIQVRLANLDGKIFGYLAAAAVLASVIAFIAQKMFH